MMSIIMVDLTLFVNKDESLKKLIKKECSDCVGGYMEEVNRLEGRINFIEREELARIKDDISEIKCNQVETGTLVKQFIKTTELQADTMDAMKSAIYEMSASIKDSNKGQFELTQNIKDLNTRFDTLENNVDCKISKVNDRINCQEEKGKFDWMEYVKNKIIPMLIGGGVIGAIISILGKVGVF